MNVIAVKKPDNRYKIQIHDESIEKEIHVALDWDQARMNLLYGVLRDIMLGTATLIQRGLHE